MQRNPGILIDTSALLAYYAARDAHHTQARSTMSSLKGAVRVVPAPVLVGLFHMIASRIHYDKAVQVHTIVRNSFDIVPLAVKDLERMEVIMRQYQDAEFDYTDAAIMALSERLKITRVFTFDRRDFSIFRPTHTPTLDLIP